MPAALLSHSSNRALIAAAQLAEKSTDHFFHPIHHHPVESSLKPTSWYCDGFGQPHEKGCASKAGAGARWRCVAGCDFDLCASCMRDVVPKKTMYIATAGTVALCTTDGAELRLPSASVRPLPDRSPPATASPAVGTTESARVGSIAEAEECIKAGAPPASAPPAPEGAATTGAALSLSAGSGDPVRTTDEVLVALARLWDEVAVGVLLAMAGKVNPHAGLRLVRAWWGDGLEPFSPLHGTDVTEQLQPFVADARITVEGKYSIVFGSVPGVDTPVLIVQFTYVPEPTHAMEDVR